jgi:hypothetical protein
MKRILADLDKAFGQEEKSSVRGRIKSVSEPSSEPEESSANISVRKPNKVSFL